VGSVESVESRSEVEVSVAVRLDRVLVLPLEVDFGRSLLCQFIWIMGANRLKAVMDPLSSGTVWVRTSSSIVLPLQVTKGTSVDVTILVHVWPLMLAQP